MNKSSLAFGLVVLAMGGTALWVQHRSNAALRREMATLRDEVRQARQSRDRAPGTAASTGPATAVAADGAVVVRRVDAGDNELAAMVREKVAPPPKNPPEPRSPGETANPIAGTAMAADGPTGVIPAGELKNLGRGTPEASVQTALWAAVGGEIEALAATLRFSEGTKAKADAWFEGLSDPVRREYGSPEKVMARMISREAVALSSVQVLGRSEISADRVEVQVRLETDEGRGKEEQFLMARGAQGWGMVLPDELVQKLARRLGEEK